MAESTSKNNTAGQDATPKPWDKLTGAAKVEAKQQAVFTMRTAGYNFDAIAKEVGYSDRAGAWRAWMSVKERLTDEPLDETRLLELHRLDEMLRSIWARVLRGELAAMTIALKVMDRRAAYLGLDAAKKLEVYTTDAISEEIRRLEERLGDQADTTPAS